MKFALCVLTGHLINVAMLERLEAAGGKFPRLRELVGKGTGKYMAVPHTLERFCRQPLGLEDKAEAIEVGVSLDPQRLNPLVVWANTERKRRFPNALVK